MRKKLEFQADRIEAVLTMHKVPARVTGGTVTPRWVCFKVQPAPGSPVDKIKGLGEELAAALEVSSCRVSRRGVVVDVEIARDDPQPVWLLPLFRQLQADEKFSIPPMTAILGLAEDGAPLLIRLPSPDVGNILVVGAEGAGKTNLLRSMAMSLAWTNSADDLVFIVLGDGLPGLERLVENHQIRRVENFGMAVLEGVKAAGKRVVFVGDDVHGGGGETARYLARLLKIERHHYILSWDGVPPPEIAWLFPVRLVGRVTSTEDARAATGWNGSGAERLMGRGDFVAVAEGRVHRFQAAFIGPNELVTVPALTANAAALGRSGVWAE